jgi:hypothetical protein
MTLILGDGRKQAIAQLCAFLSPVRPSIRDMASRVENRRSGFSLPVAADEAFASPPQSGLA